MHTTHSATSQRGFSLLELVITVAIIGVLASIAFPAYIDRTRRANRVEAQAALLDVAALQERFFLKNNRFTSDLVALGFADADDGLADDLTRNKYYKVTVTLAEGETQYVAKAQPSGVEEAKIQSGDKTCSTFTINQIGQRTAQNVSGDATTSECWR